MLSIGKLSLSLSLAVCCRYTYHQILIAMDLQSSIYLTLSLSTSIDWFSRNGFADYSFYSESELKKKNSFFTY